QTTQRGLVNTMDRKRRTQWAAQFAVASELCKQGYEVAFTMGHTTPEADLMVMSESRRAFLVDVKGLYKRNPFLIKAKAARTDLYYILAFVPDVGQNEFFVMSQDEVRRVVAAGLKRLGRTEDYSMPGIAWPSVQPFKDKWRTLPK